MTLKDSNKILIFNAIETSKLYLMFKAALATILTIYVLEIGK